MDGQGAKNFQIGRSTRAFPILCVLCLVAMSYLAFASTGGASAQGEARALAVYRSPGPLHKATVEADSEARAALEASGAHLLADYGSFAVYEASDAALAKAGPAARVRDDF